MNLKRRTALGMGVRLTWWESLLLAGPTVLGVLFLVGGEPLAGVVLLALVLLVVASRGQIPERNVAGGYATSRGALGLFRVFALFAIYLVIMLLLIAAQRDDWSSETPGSVAVYAMGGLAFFLVRDIHRIGNEAFDWLRGGDMEVLVAKELDQLRNEGWLLTHDLKIDEGGNLDHFLSGRYGAIDVETKSGRDSSAARRQAIRNAVWAKEKFGQRYVTAVLCVGTEPPPRPTRNGFVWIMGPKDIRDFVRDYRGPR